MTIVYDITYRQAPSDMLTDMVAKAWAMAHDTKHHVSFVFNHTTVVVASDSNLELIMRDWKRVRNGLIEGAVGPYPDAELPEEEKLLMVTLAKFVKGQNALAEACMR